MIVVNMLDFLKNRLSSDDPEIILGDSLDFKSNYQKFVNHLIVTRMWS